MTRRLALAAVVTLAACAAQPRTDRVAELAACQLISKTGDALAECLVLKYSRRAESAGPAKTAWQWRLDSIRLEHEAQAAAILARRLEREDSMYRAARRAQARRDAARAAAAERIDSAFVQCVDVALAWWKGKPEAGYDGYRRRRVVCDSARATAQRRAGLPVDPIN